MDEESGASAMKKKERNCPISNFSPTIPTSNLIHAKSVIEQCTLGIPKKPFSHHFSMRGGNETTFREFLTMPPTFHRQPTAGKPVLWKIDEATTHQTLECEEKSMVDIESLCLTLF
jgi:hypothetical protein